MLGELKMSSGAAECVSERIADQHFLKFAHKGRVALNVAVLLLQAQKMSSAQIAPGIEVPQQGRGSRMFHVGYRFTAPLGTSSVIMAGLAAARLLLPSRVAPASR